MYIDIFYQQRETWEKMPPKGSPKKQLPFLSGERYWVT